MDASRARRARHVMRALLLLLSVGTLATGCGGGESGDAAGAPPSTAPAQVSTPALPAGYTRVDAGGLSLAYPPGWETAQPPQGWALAMELKQENVPMARLGVITTVPQTDDATTVANTAFAGVQLGTKIEGREPNKTAQVPGATGAIRVDYTYEDRATGNKAQAADLSVVYGERKAATVRITGVRGRLTPEMIDQILRTVIAKAS